MDPNNQKSSHGQDGQQPPAPHNDPSLFAPRQFSESEEIRPNLTHAYPWQSNTPTDTEQSLAPSAHEVPAPQTPQPSPQQQTQWTPPTTAMPAANTQRPPAPGPGSLPQYGGPMAELPPLVSEVPQPQKPHKKRTDWRKRLLLGGFIAFAVLIVGLVVALVLSMSNAKKQEEQKQAAIIPISYNGDAVKATVNKDGTLATSKVQALNKTSTFYTVFKQAAMQPVVHTKWDVYYTDKQDDKRADQYTMFDVTVDYRTKTYSYSDDAYSNIGVIKTRCIDGQQYTYNGSKLVATAGWQPASDSTTCKPSVVATRMSDGANSGGLTEKQADTFVKTLNKSQSLKVNAITMVEKAGKHYLKIAVTVTPKQQTSKVYWGMQNFMNAFQSTGVSAEKHPYTYFGPANAGMKMNYFVDPATLLPVYATFDQTESVNEAGQTLTPKTWGQRTVEYDFPKEVAKLTLDDVAPIAFTTWPEF